MAVRHIVDKEHCYPVTRTVCPESIETIPNEISVHTYGPKDVETKAKTVSVVYTTPCVTQMVLVCDPGYQQYGHGHEVHCREVLREPCNHTPCSLIPVREKGVAKERRTSEPSASEGVHPDCSLRRYLRLDNISRTGAWSRAIKTHSINTRESSFSSFGTEEVRTVK